MECIFLDVDKRKCSLQWGCEGIRQLSLELGGKVEFARNFSSFIWKWSMSNRILDLAQDPTTGFGRIALKKIARIISVFLPFLVPDTFGISRKLKEIENQVSDLEKSCYLKDPMIYFTKVGEAYAIAFQYAAVGARCDKNTRKKISELGQKVGILIAFRDAINDLKQDRITGSFNPFKKWEKSEILRYYKFHATILITEIKQLMQDKSAGSISMIANASESSIKTSLLKYVSVATVPYFSCKAVQKAPLLQANTCSYILQQQPLIWIIPIVILFIIMVCTCVICERKGCCSSSDCSGCSGCDCSGCDCNSCDCSGCDCSGCDCGGCSGCSC